MLYENIIIKLLTNYESLEKIMKNSNIYPIIITCKE